MSSKDPTEERTFADKSRTCIKSDVTEHLSGKMQNKFLNIMHTPCALQEDVGASH